MTEQQKQKDFVRGYLKALADIEANAKQKMTFYGQAVSLYSVKIEGLKPRTVAFMKASENMTLATGYASAYYDIVLLTEKKREPWTEEQQKMRSEYAIRANIANSKEYAEGYMDALDRVLNHVNEYIDRLQDENIKLWKQYTERHLKAKTDYDRLMVEAHEGRMHYENNGKLDATDNIRNDVKDLEIEALDIIYKDDEEAE